LATVAVSDVVPFTVSEAGMVPRVTVTAAPALTVTVAVATDFPEVLDVAVIVTVPAAVGAV
jgi:hypothetical protein